MVAVNREAEKGKPTKKIAKMADKLVDKAVGGDVAAIKEVGDRLDGKSAQVITGDGDGGSIHIKVELVTLDD
jgi:hypothetical protein|tara:strand:+ start:443 stop:658 length:216 start_codon:yes stop_codon:yes gene_type:complete